MIAIHYKTRGDIQEKQSQEGRHVQTNIGLITYRYTINKCQQ